MPATDTVSSGNKGVLALVRHYLKKKAPSGYSLMVPKGGVMYVRDGLDKPHERWYVVVKPEPEYIATTRRDEYLAIMAEIERIMHEKHRKTVYLTSMLPMV